MSRFSPVLSATPTSSVMNLAEEEWYPLFASRTCPFRRMFLPSYPSCLPCCLNGKEAHSRFHQAGEKAVILFNEMSEVVALPEFTKQRKNLSFLQFQSFGLRRVFVDNTRSRCMECLKRSYEKAFGSLSIKSDAQQER